jgi:predicted transcriptional regulator
MGPRMKYFLSDVLDLHDSKIDILRNIKRAAMKELYLSQDLELSKSRINNLISTAQSKYDLIF